MSVLIKYCGNILSENILFSGLRLVNLDRVSSCSQIFLLETTLFQLKKTRYDKYSFKIIHECLVVQKTEKY